MGILYTQTKGCFNLTEKISLLPVQLFRGMQQGCLIEFVAGLDEVVGGEEEAAGAAGGVAYDLPRLGLHDVDDGADEGAGREVLSCPHVGGAGSFFEKAFVDVSLDVHVHSRPVGIIDHRDDALEVGMVRHLVLGLAEPSEARQTAWKAGRQPD